MDLQTETKAERQKRKARERVAAWRKANPGRAKELRRQSHAKRKENWQAFLVQERERYIRNREAVLARQAAYRSLNPERTRSAVRKHYRANKSAYVAYCAQRKAARLLATPTWADTRLIAAIYAEAKRLSDETGVPHEVDHIIPLQSRYVCGLHIPCNLQVVPRDLNRRKGNSLGDEPSHRLRYRSRVPRSPSV